MNISVLPGSSIKGTVGKFGCPPIPGDKSLSHRSALFAAMAEGESRIENFQVSGVTRVMLDALSSLGISMSLSDNVLEVTGMGLSGFKSTSSPVYCGNSATTLRLLAGSLAATGVYAALDGSDGLRRRPMNRIVEPLQLMGVPISASNDGTAPLILAARDSNKKLKALDYTLPVASAQVKSCLLLAALSAGGPSFVREPERSRDHTERMLASMGVNIITNEKEIEGKRFIQTCLFPLTSGHLTPLRISLPGDTSAAAFLIVAALITPGSKISIPDVGLNPTRTGLLDVLQQMGANIEISEEHIQGGEPVGTLTITESELHGIEVGGELVVRMIDEFPIFAVAAAYARGKTIVRNAEELRFKESDRIGRLCAELFKLGVDIQETEDGFIILSLIHI